MYSKKCAVGLWFLCIATGAQAADSQVVGSDATFEVAKTVNQMIAIDAARAIAIEQRLLQEEKNKLSKTQAGISVEGENVAPVEAKTSAAPQTAAIPEAVRMELIGIFGIGKSLKADIEIQGNRYRFVRGYTLPEGASNSFAYRLVSIKPPCATLHDASGKTNELCLNQSSF